MYLIFNDKNECVSISEEEYRKNKAKYVYDRAKDNLKLPDISCRFLQVRGIDEDISLVEEGPPNITGTLFAISELFATNGYSSADSALYKYSGGPWVHDTQRETDGGNAGTIGFDASRSNKIYGKSSTVQPSAIKLIAGIKY